MTIRQMWSLPLLLGYPLCTKCNATDITEIYSFRLEIKLFKRNAQYMYIYFFNMEIESHTIGWLTVGSVVI